MPSSRASSRSPGESGTAPTILLVGARGQVGHELARVLAPLGRVVAPSRRELDLASPDSTRDAVRTIAPRLTVNAAAYTAVDRAESEPELCRAVNAVGPRVLAEEMARLGGALVHYSTDYVFDGTKSAPYTEDDPASPLNEYGRTKLAGEAAVAATGVPALVFRTSWVYGVRGHNFLRTILRLARERAELRVVDDQRGAPTWCAAVAERTAEVVGRAVADPRGLVDAMAEVAGVYHLTAGGTTTWHGFAESILALDPERDQQVARRVVPIATSDHPTPARRPANSSLCCDLAAARLGVRIPHWREQLAVVLGDAAGTDPT